MFESTFQHFIDGSIWNLSAQSKEIAYYLVMGFILIVIIRQIEKIDKGTFFTKRLVTCPRCNKPNTLLHGRSCKAK